MRKLIIIGLLALGLALPGTAQITNTSLSLSNAPTSPTDFLNTVKSYFTSYSDLQTFQTNDTFDVWTGAEYVNNANTAVALGVSYNTGLHLGKISFGAESVTRNAPGI